MSLFNDNNSIKMFGLKEINQMLEQLPKEVSNSRKWNNLWKEIGKPLIKNAKERADQISAKSPDGTGRLGKSIKYFTTKRTRKFLGGMIGPRVKGSFSSFKKSGYYGAWVEYGGSVKFGNKGFGKDQKFMKPAYDATIDLMNKNALNSAKKTVEKLMKSHLKKTNKFGILGR